MSRFSAKVLGPSNKFVGCEFDEVDGGCFRVRFVPSEPGTYVIQIFKGSDKEPLSEFTHNVASEYVGDKATFTINIEEQAKTYTYTATVTSPSNVFVECIVEQSEDGNCMVRFTPKELGDHVVRIYVEGDDTPASEFVYNVTDLNAEVGCGSGGQRKAKPPSKYTVRVTSPSQENIECEFEELDDEKCRVRFVPRECGEYMIKIYKIGKDTPIYEFAFTAEQSNLGESASFTITIQEEKIRFTATVTSPSNAEVECTIEEYENDNYLIRFIPREIGNYVIKLFQDGSSTPTSQFTYKVIGSGTNIQKAGQRVYRVGETVRLTFNTDGRLIITNSKYSASITAPSGSFVKCIFEELDDGTCKVRFVPNELGEHTIKLFKVGNDSPISQFTFDVEGEHLNETASFSITIQERVRKFSATVTSPSNKEIDCTVEESEDGHCIVRFTPTEVGNYIIRIYENGESVPAVQIIYKIVDHRYDLSRKSPNENIFRVGELVRIIIDVVEAKRKYSATVTSPSNALIECTVEESEEGRCLVRFTPTEPGDYIIRTYQGNNPIPVCQFNYKVEAQNNDGYRVGDAAKFTMDVNETQKREYSATVTSPSGESLHCRVEEVEDGSCRVRFIPREAGDYVIRLFQNDMQISQFTYKVTETIKREPTNTFAYGSNLKDEVDGKYVYIQDQVFKIGEKVSFYVNLDEKRKFSASVTSPAHTLLDTEVVETGPDEFSIRFTPTELGDHLIKIYMGNSNVPVYQFIYKVRGFLRKMVEFKVTSFSSEPGKLAYKIMCPPNSKINYGGNKDGGIYEINVRFNASTESLKPTIGKGADRCTAEGPGLSYARVGEVATFKVNTSKAQRGSLMVGVEGPRQPAKEIVVKHIGQQVYSVDYVLDMIGNYTLYVMWSGQHIPGSPFHVKV